MAKTDKDRTDKTKGQAKDGDAAGWNFDALPEALRDAARRASDLAQNPYARSLLAAGLVGAAAALASNKKVQKATQRNLKQASEAIEIGADNAGKIGIAMVNAATEAVQRMLNLSAAAAGGAESGDTAAASPAAPATAKSSTTPRKPRASASAASGSAAKPKAAARKPAASAKSSTAAPKPRAKSATKPVAAKTAKAAPAKSTRARAPKKSD